VSQARASLRRIAGCSRVLNLPSVIDTPKGGGALVTEAPRWLRDLKRFLPLKSQFVLSGNVRDRYPLDVGDGPPLLLSLVDYLGAQLVRIGTQRILAFDPVSGFRVPPAIERDSSSDKSYFGGLGLNFDDAGCAAVSNERFFETLGKIVETSSEPVAVIADFAARLTQRPDHLMEVEHRGFTRALVLAHHVEPKPHPISGAATFNPIIWIVEKEGDLPDWFTVDNPRIRHIAIPKPDHEVRRSVARSLLRTVPGGTTLSELERDEIARRLVEATEGLRLLDLDGIAEVMRSEQVDAREMDDAVRRYKLGVTEDPWQKIDRQKLKNAESIIRERVKGQDRAVRHMLDIITRASTGIGGTRGGRPRGVAFLAGPTGVGKTELAKTITELLFGDERAYIRFDMSEFSAEHADQRLIGAPPGYVGYDTGGELTNAIRERPFSVVLFDEIEKAHARILDKFLQVLDDGVLTSGRGERVYFSESLIIFTSNLGISVPGPDGIRRSNVTADESYPEVERKVRDEITRHFKLEIGRPELLNRIGENIIVFDFIRPALAGDIFDTLIGRTLSDIAHDQKILVTLNQSAHDTLKAFCLKDLSNGGRGIRNFIEAGFVNPLARLLFEAGTQRGSHVEISDVIVAQSGVTLVAK
jgi:hypothetical protein